jgi:hypothetical protein
MPEGTTPQKKPFLVIYNVHVAGCGEPPSYVIRSDTPGYHCYYENRYGEQWVFMYDYETETGTLRGGDAGWNNVYQVVDGRVDPMKLTLDKEEQLWVRICWMTATWGKDYRDEKRAGKG